VWHIQLVADHSSAPVGGPQRKGRHIRRERDVARIRDLAASGWDQSEAGIRALPVKKAPSGGMQGLQRAESRIEAEQIGED